MTGGNVQVDVDVVNGADLDSVKVGLGAREVYSEGDGNHEVFL